MDRGPEIEDIAVGGAGRMETLEDFLAQMHREGAIACLVGGMNGARFASLGTGAFETGQAAEVGQDLFHIHVAA